LLNIAKPTAKENTAVEVFAETTRAIIGSTHHFHPALKKNGIDIAINAAQKLLFPSVPMGFVFGSASGVTGIIFEKR